MIEDPRPKKKNPAVRKLYWGGDEDVLLVMNFEIVQRRSPMAMTQAASIKQTGFLGMKLMSGKKTMMGMMPSSCTEMTHWNCSELIPKFLRMTSSKVR